MVTFVYANAVVGSIEKVDGSVKVKKEGSLKKSKVKIGTEIVAGDLLTTSKKSSAVIKLKDGSTIVLDVSSSVHFASATSAEQKTGKIYYKITSRDAANSLKVKTPFAIIGIKGTTFVVNASENASVTLKEGLIGVASVKEEFNLYRKKMEEEFNKFKSDMNAEFEKFKSKQSGYMAPVKTKSFDLKEGNRISFSGNKVHEDQWNKNDDAEFDHFEALINSATPSYSNKSTSEEVTQETPATDGTTSATKKEDTKEVKPSENKEAAQVASEPKENDDWDSSDDDELDQIGTRR